MVDVIVSHIFGRPVFTWGAGGSFGKGEARAAYLQALKEADGGEINELIRFARG
jgi:hypothetical protein